MTPEQEQVELLVLMDGGGDYYLIPRAALERARVTDAQRNAIEQALDGDTSGYALVTRATGRGGLPGRAYALLAAVGMLSLSAAVLADLGVAMSPGHA